MHLHESSEGSDIKIVQRSFGRCFNMSVFVDLPNSNCFHFGNFPFFSFFAISFILVSIFSLHISRLNLSFVFVTVPKTEPIGDTIRYVKEGSRVTLHCVISGAIDPPLYVIWYHGQQQIFPDNPRHWKTEVSHQDVHTSKMTTSNDENEALALSQQSMFDSRKTVRLSSFTLLYTYYSDPHELNK